MTVERDEFLYHMNRMYGAVEKVDAKQDRLLERAHAHDTEIALLKQAVGIARRHRAVWRTVLHAVAAIAGAAFHAAMSSGAKP
jgi:hypothetical protein